MAAEKKSEYIQGNYITDHKGRKVYYLPKKQIGYVVSAARENRFNLFANRYLFELMVLVILVSYSNDPLWIGIGLAVFALVAGAIEYYFRYKFLPSLTVLTNYVPKNLPSKAQAVKDQSKGRTISLFLLFVAMAILLVINASGKNLVVVIGSFAGSLFAIYKAVELVYLYFIKK